MRKSIALFALILFIGGCVNLNTGNSSDHAPSKGTLAPDLSIITGRVPGEYELENFQGVLGTSEQCMSLIVTDGSEYPVIWPPGFQLDPANNSVGDTNGTVTVGERLTESRGFLVDRQTFDSGLDKAELEGLDDCGKNAETFLVLVRVEDFDTPE